MDLHAGQIQGFFSKPVDHMTAMFFLTQYFQGARGLSPLQAGAAFLAALDTYRKTSPEMVVFGRMLGDALPRP
jgi:phosphoribosylpyrophosphate synthetase